MLREFHADAGQFTNPDNSLTANGAAHRLDGAARRRRQIDLEAFACLAQRIDSMIHLKRLLWEQPASERQDALRLFEALRQHQCDVTADIGTIVAGCPRDQNLRLGKQQSTEPIRFQLQGLSVGRGVWSRCELRERASA